MLPAPHSSATAALGSAPSGLTCGARHGAVPAPCLPCTQSGPATQRLRGAAGPWLRARRLACGDSGAAVGSARRAGCAPAVACAKAAMGIRLTCGCTENSHTYGSGIQRGEERERGTHDALKPTTALCKALPPSLPAWLPLYIYLSIYLSIFNVERERDGERWREGAIDGGLGEWQCE